MSLKDWILHKVNGLTTRGDLPRSPVLHPGGAALPTPIHSRAGRGASGASPAPPPRAPHLGPYAPLVSAIREELEQFVVSNLRLHLAIAERDRYLLTSIDVRAPESDEAAELVGRFMREFKPEQIKQYVAKEIIAGLPNAAAIDLSQFAGLNAGNGEEPPEHADNYSDLLAELRGAAPASGVRTYEVSLVGRWSEVGPAGAGAAWRPDAPRAPLAGRSMAIAIEDADGSRQVVLQPVLAGHRYSVGKGACDIVVNGVYASRRHCEIWLDQGTWWVTDTGSTNGIRVERGKGVLGRSVTNASTGAEVEIVAVPPGSRIVLSAHAEGGVADYPRLVLDAGRDANTLATPIAPALAIPPTPSTPIVATTACRGAATLTVQMASGIRTVELHTAALPFSIGRSRSQALVVDWAHEGVSGHHVDITDLDESGATVVVHGDNGVSVAGTHYPTGARLRWMAGESMLLGRVIGRESECRLTLSRPV